MMTHLVDTKIEVFKTNLTSSKEADKVVKVLLRYYPHSYINFDLEDCDNILRVEGPDIEEDKIIDLVISQGHYCEVLGYENDSFNLAVS